MKFQIFMVGLHRKAILHFGMPANMPDIVKVYERGTAALKHRPDDVLLILGEYSLPIGLIEADSHRLPIDDMLAFSNNTLTCGVFCERAKAEASAFPAFLVYNN